MQKYSRALITAGLAAAVLVYSSKKNKTLKSNSF